MISFIFDRHDNGVQETLNLAGVKFPPLEEVEDKVNASPMSGEEPEPSVYGRPIEMGMFESKPIHFAQVAPAQLLMRSTMGSVPFTIDATGVPLVDRVLRVFRPGKNHKLIPLNDTNTFFIVRFKFQVINDAS